MDFTDCSICDETFTEQHHLISIATYKESKIVIPLCPTCHRLFHLIETAAKYNDLHVETPTTKAGKAIREFMSQTYNNMYKTKYLTNLVYLSWEMSNNFVDIYDNLVDKFNAEYPDILRSQGWWVIPPVNRFSQNMNVRFINGDDIVDDTIKLLELILSSDSLPPLYKVRAAAILKNAQSEA